VTVRVAGKKAEKKNRQCRPTQCHLKNKCRLEIECLPGIFFLRSDLSAVIIPPTTYF
jgi:hypothetical protein